MGFLFESNRHTRYSTRTVQAIVTACARTAGSQKRVYPYLLQHSIATILLDSRLVPIVAAAHISCKRDGDRGAFCTQGLHAVCFSGALHVGEGRATDCGVAGPRAV
jgi:hypothetical protein